MIHLHDICYLRLGCKDIDQMVGFATGILGLELRERTATHAYLRCDNSAYNLCYIQDDVPDVSAFEVRHLSEFDKAESELGELGIKTRRGTASECEERRVQGMLAFEDTAGNQVELVYRPHVTGVRYFPSRDAGITEFGHFGLHTGKPGERELRFWTEVMNGRVSDIIGDAALIRIDEVHHKIALFPSNKVGVQHVNFQVASIDDVMRSWYFLQERGVPIVFGPGRHPTSTAMFIYFMGPDRRVYEYSSGVKLITDEANYTPRQFEMKPSSFCMWGAKPNVDEFE
jgi:2,3-dihydroxy-p-cumate/2,3-dihydroxybenzoate 3,4-dioxygenase